MFIFNKLAETNRLMGEASSERHGDAGGIDWPMLPFRVLAWVEEVRNFGLGGPEGATD